ncbi:unnamed protein product [Caenorhabditis nigoni]
MPSVVGRVCAPVAQPDRKDYEKTEDLAPPSWEQRFIAKYGKVIGYPSRAIHVFQQQDDGTSWMVIDCLDGVKLFQSASLRTQIYWELVSSYFDLARSMGLLHQKLCSPLMSAYDVVGKLQKLGKNSWQFNNPRRARFASVGLIDLI